MHYQRPWSDWNWAQSSISTMPYLLLLVPVIFAFFYTLRPKKPSVNAPRWGGHLGAKARSESLLKDSRGIYLECYGKLKDSLGCFIPVPGESTERLVISPRYLDELRKLPASVLSFSEAFSESPEQKYTNSPPPNFFHITPRIIKSKLTPCLTRLCPTLSADSKAAVASELGPCKTWTSIKIHEKLMRVIAVLSGRVFIGPELCRDERYIDAAINYTNDFSRAMMDLQKLNSWTRPLFANGLESVKVLRRREEEFVRLLRPVVAARREAKIRARSDGEGADGQEDENNKDNDMLAWFIDEAESSGIVDLKHIALIQLALFAVAFHTTALTATNVLYDLASSPEYLEPLREEIELTLSEHDGTFSSAALQSLRKLDSFVKESVRFRPLSTATFQRRVLKDITLLDGTSIPKDTIIECPNHAIAQGAEFFEDSEHFRPWRFAELHEGTTIGKEMFASVSGMLGTFGFGPHACPGRFFAAAEIKMVLAWTILGYEVKMPKDLPSEKLESETGRYRNKEFGLMSSPDLEGELSFKRRGG